MLYHVGHLLLLFNSILQCYVVVFSRTTFTFLAVFGGLMFRSNRQAYEALSRRHLPNVAEQKVHKRPTNKRWNWKEIRNGFGTNTIETILSLTCHSRPVPILERVSWQLWTLFQHWHSDSAANPHVIVVSLSWPWVKVYMTWGWRLAEQTLQIDVISHNANMTHANPTKYSSIKIAPLSP